MCIHLPDQALRGEIVVLRLWEPDDAEWYVNARDEEVLRWTNEPRDLTSDAARQAIEAYRREPTYAGFAVTDAENGGLFGNVAVVIRDESQPIGEVMYWLAAGARGRGAATDAVRTISWWAFDALSLERIELLV